MAECLVGRNQMAFYTWASSVLDTMVLRGDGLLLGRGIGMGECKVAVFKIP